MDDGQQMRIEAHLIAISATLCGIERSMRMGNAKVVVPDYEVARKRFKDAVADIRENHMPRPA